MIAFDEAHAMANALGGSSTRGKVMLAASMSPSMAAALDWSRGIQSRSIVP